jgi:hypothetical protein
MAHGLPCTAHDYPVTRFALGEHGRFGDFTRPGSLTALLRASQEERRDLQRERARHGFVYENFSWDRLRPRYVELLRSGGAAAGYGA